MEENKLPEIPEIKPTEEQKLKELADYISNLQFLSNQVQFNGVIYQILALILEKLTKIEEKLNPKDAK